MNGTVPWQIVSDAHRDQLGEGPTWSAARRALLWVDTNGQTVQQLCLHTGQRKCWPMPERVGWVVERLVHEPRESGALNGSGDLIVRLKSGIASLSLDPFRLHSLYTPEPDRPQNRMNDAKVDRHGHLWFGTKDDRDQQASSAFYRLGSGPTVVREGDRFRVPNGPAFSANGRMLWLADSLSAA